MGRYFHYPLNTEEVDFWYFIFPFFLIYKTFLSSHICKQCRPRWDAAVSVISSGGSTEKKANNLTPSLPAPSNTHTQHSFGEHLIKFHMRGSGYVVDKPLTLFLIWFFTSHQQSFSYVGTGLPGLNQYYARINVSCSRTTTQWCRWGTTRDPSVSSQALYHWATALP